MILPDCDWEFFLPLEKSEGATEEKRLVRGLASCEDLDAQGEVVVQKGMDLDYLRTRGWLNWDHKEGPENLLGEPLHVEIVSAESHPVLSKAGVRGLACYVEGKLYKGLARADATWYHLNNPERTRPIAWSIQGRALERDGHKITKSEIRHLAITHQPIQTRSFAEIAKSLAAGALSTSSGAPLLLENLHGRMTSVLWGQCEKACYDRTGRFHKGLRGAMEHLVGCHGEDVKDAYHFLKALLGSRLHKGIGDALGPQRLRRAA